jgi:antitoxin component of MazEF toxin-antitoxin module
MVKTISRIGDAPGLVFDAALLEMTGLKAGDPVNVSVLPDGAISLVPVRPIIPQDDGEDTSHPDVTPWS